jgi:hypothetical protein
MRKIIFVILALIILTFLIALLISGTNNDTNRPEQTAVADFSIETKAICEELKEPDCYFKCHDEVFLKIGNSETSLYKMKEYVCHRQDWIDPRKI